jgi:hypothetical protein
MTTRFGIVVPCALVLGFAAGAAQAQFGPPDQRETWTETSRTQVWKNAFGECWHSAYGPPPPANLCGPVPVAQYVPPPAPAPVVVAPPPRLEPAPAPVVAAPPPAPAPVYVAPVPRRDRN